MNPADTAGTPGGTARFPKGYFQIYTGDGKGKTTAAFGLALRAALAGKRVYIGQFVKSMEYHEARCGGCLPNIEVHQYGTGCIFGRAPDENDIAADQAGLTAAAAVLAGGASDLVILDELMIALHLGLLKLPAVTEAIQKRAPWVEVVATGRYAPQALMDMADLVTEMREIKHYYTRGVLARDGIER